MDIEKRLEYLISKRAELISSINALNKELVNIKSTPASLPEKTMIKEFEARDIYDFINTNKNKKLKVVFDSCVKISSSLATEEYAYLYFNKSTKINSVTDGNEISLHLFGNNPNEVRPLIVFYDKKNKKISHEFFSFNTPMKFILPEATDNFSIGFRITGKSECSVTKIEFGVSTLQDLADVSFIDRIYERINELPESNGCKYYEKYKGNVGLVADQFLYDAYKDTCNCIYITPDNYKDSKLDILIVASAWHGLNNEWDGMTKKETETGKTIFEIINYFKYRQVPVVFYSKEDPPNYEHFVHIARECDYIFTSASEMIEYYKKDCDTEKVDSLCFGINPLFHNPVGISPLPAEEGVVFSGSWMSKYPERIAIMEQMFDGVIDSGLDIKIIDRNYERNDPKYFFPQKYYSYVSPALDHETLQKVHKLYGWAININSVTESHTMFANRVYELQAIGNVLISNHSIGVEEKFDGVFIVENSEQVKSILKKMSNDELYRIRIQNIRRVMTGETTFDRLNQILNTVGIEYTADNRRIAVVVNEITDELMKQFNNQTYRNRVIIEEKNFDEEVLENVDMIAFWSPEYKYGEYYLEDLSNGFKYTGCSYITKDSYFENENIIEGIENNYVKHCNKFNSVFWKDDYDMKELLAFPESIELKNGYAIDHFELVKLGGK